MQKRAAQGVSMSAAANLLDASKVENLLRTASEDKSLRNAVDEAMKTKASKRVTLEELIAVEDSAKNTMDEASAELVEAFKGMLAKHQQCQQCSDDCTQQRWRKYEVHTMAECKQYCKVMICKDSDSADYAQEAAALEEAMKVPHYAAPTKFSSYLETYSKTHGQEAIVNDDDKFEIVWEQPTEQEVQVESTPDPVEQLRAQNRWSMEHKSSEQVLKELHQQEEDHVKEAAAEKLVKALA